MLWFTFAFTGMFIWSVTAVVDRYALSGRVKSKVLYVVIPALLQLPLVLVLYSLFTPTSFSPTVFVVGLLGGLIEIGFLYYLFVAISSEEVGRVFPLLSVGPVFTLIGGWVLFGDTLTHNELLAVACLIVGGIIVAIKRNDKDKKFRISEGVRPLFFGTLLLSAYTLSLRYTFLESDFATGFFYSRIGFFIGGILLLLVYREELSTQWRVITSKLKILIVGNQVIAFGGHAFYFSALALANAALVQSVLSIQSIIIFILASLVSVFNPRLVAESLSWSDIVQKIIGIGFIVARLNFAL